MFKNYKAEVENQLGKTIKSVKSDRGGEYYSRYNGSGEQHPSPFAEFLEKCGIIPQYTMSSSLSMNGVHERRNRTLKEKTELLWGEGLKTTTYLLNRVPTKAIVSCYFIGHSKRSRGYKFYNPTIRSIFETENTRFFMEVEFVGAGEEG